MRNKNSIGINSQILHQLLCRGEDGEEIFIGEKIENWLHDDVDSWVSRAESK